MSFYHVEINSIYIQLVQVRFKGEGYTKYTVNYFLKYNDKLIATERSVKISDKTREMWQTWQRLK